MGSIQRILDDHGLTVTVVPSDGNPAMPNQDEGMTHWTVTFEGGSTPVSFPVSILREGGDPSPPSAAEALTFFAADLRHPALEGSPEEWLDANGIALDAPEAGAWLRARVAALAVLEDARGLPQELRERLAIAPEAPVPGL